MGFAAGLWGHLFRASVVDGFSRPPGFTVQGFEVASSNDLFSFFVCVRVCVCLCVFVFVFVFVFVCVCVCVCKFVLLQCGTHGLPLPELNTASST